MKRISILVFVAAGFMFIAAPIYMSEMSHQVFVSGNLLGHAQMVNGVWAIPLDEFAKAIGGNGGTSLQQAGLTINGGRLRTLPQLQTSNSADTFTLVSPRDAATGQASGKRSHKPFVVVKQWDAASPLLSSGGKTFVPLSDVAKAFGGTFTGPVSLPNGAPINLTPGANGAIILQR